MKYREFRKLVKTMMNQQKVFFATKLGEDLDKAKSLEVLVRKTIKEEDAREADEGQMTLWGDPKPLDAQNTI